MHELYTERQKKHHSFRATLTKTHHIRINHFGTLRSYSTPYEAHLKYQRVAFVRKGKNVVKLKKVIFKNHRNCSLRTSRKGHLFRTFNSYSLNFNGGLCTCNPASGFCLCYIPCPGGEQFLWFFKNDLLQFHCILLLFDSSQHLFLLLCLVRSTVANLYPIMSHFSALDFGECRSEEVVSLFWRSVYIVWECASLIQQIKSLLIIMIALCRWKRKANAGIKVSSSSTTWWIKDGCDQTSSLFRTFSQSQQQRRRFKKKNEQAGEHRCFQTLKEERIVALAHKTKRREAAKR